MTMSFIRFICKLSPNLTRWHTCRCHKTVQGGTWSNAFCHSESNSGPPKFRKVERDILKIMNYKILHVDQEKVIATIQHPGISPSDYDYNGHPKIWKIMKNLEAVRFYAHHYPLDNEKTFRDYAKLTEDRLVFIVTAEIEIFKEMYDFNISRYPLQVGIHGGYVGNTSLTTITKVYNEQNIQLCSNSGHIVTVDQISRRPKPLPVWWREKYSKSGKLHKPLTMKKFEKPDETGSYQTNVAWSDTDLNCHTNWTSYANFMVDAAHHCARTGQLPLSDNFQNGLHRARFHFYGESMEGDDLTLSVWIDQENKKLVYFDVQNQKESICQCKMLFY